MFLKKNDPNNPFILILALLSWIDTLQKLPSFTTILPHKSSSIPNKKFPTLIAKLTRSDISVITIFIQLSKHFFQASSNMIIYSYIVRCEYEDIVAEWADSEIEDSVKLIYFSGFFL